MHIVNLFSAPVSSAASVALGYFDAMHVGHTALLRAAVQSGYTPCMVTFEGNFYAALGRNELPLYTAQQRFGFARACGIDTIYTVPCDDKTLAMPADEFVMRILQTGARHVVCGEDYRFGAKAYGNVALLQSLCQQHNVGVTVLSTVLDESGRKIGTAAIRSAVQKGDMAYARACLGRCYSVQGTVVHGRGQGAQMGFPTANLTIDTGLTVPAYGVYAALARVNGTTHRAVCHVGPHPTVGDNCANIEVYLLSDASTLYGRTLEVMFVDKLRDVRRFDSVERLEKQIAADCNAACAILQKEHTDD